MKIKSTILYLFIGSALHASDYENKVGELLSRGIGEAQKEYINVVRLPQPPKDKYIEDVVYNFFEKHNKSNIDNKIVVYTSVKGRMLTAESLQQLTGSVFCWFPPLNKNSFSKFDEEYIKADETFGYFKNNLNSPILERKQPFFVGIMEDAGMEGEIGRAVKNNFPDKQVNFIPKMSYFRFLFHPVTILTGAFVVWAVASGYFDKYFGKLASYKQ